MNGLDVTLTEPVRTHRIVALDKKSAEDFIANVFNAGKWFQVEPLPDDEYAIYVKAGEPWGDPVIYQRRRSTDATTIAG